MNTTMHNAKAIFLVGTLVAASVGVFGQRALGQNVPVPLINNPLVPTTVMPGSSAFTLTVNGTGFVQGSVVNWNGSPRSTTFVSQSQLTAAILASDVAAASTASISVTNPGVGTVSNISFLSITWPVSTVSLVSSAIPSGSGEVVADFNGDGRQDLAGLDYDHGELQINLGNGDGTFQGTVYYAVGGNYPSALAVGDFNGDGKPDVAVALGCLPGCPPGTVTVLLGNGDGTFQTSLPPSLVGSGPLSMVAADFDGDGKLDLAVSNRMDATVSILLGNGDGTFQPQIVVVMAPAGAGVLTAGDFNGDGKLDLAVCCGPAATGQPWPISILLGNGDGTFQSPMSFLTSGIGLYSIAAADLNGDGKLDVVAASDCQPPDQACEGLVATPGAASVLLGNGDGTFQPSVAYTAGFQGRSVAIADINGDGIPDLTVGTRCGGDPECQNPGYDFPISVFIGNGDGTFQPELQPSIYGSVYAGPLSAIADLNGDGLLDMVAPSASAVLQTTLTLSVANLTFANQTVGTSGSPQATTLSNISTKVPLTISSAQVSGTNASDFSVKTRCSKLQPKSACKVTVTFTPTGTGMRSATVSITDSAVGSPHQITLTGNGTVPAVSLLPGSLTFGTQLVNTSSPIRYVTLSNSGSGILTISSIAASGRFTQTNTCRQQLVGGAKCSIAIAFRPAVAGPLSGTLTITDNAAGSPQSVPLSGHGTVFELSSSSLSFGSQKVGTISGPQNVTLTNVDPKNSESVSFSMSGSNAQDFKQGNNCGTSLGAQSSCTIGVRFKPTAQGSRTATLEVSGGGGSPRTVILSGTAD